jgi:hypothetical protein
VLQGSDGVKYTSGVDGHPVFAQQIGKQHDPFD